MRTRSKILFCLALATVFSRSLSARADEEAAEDSALTSEELRGEMHRYYHEEKRGGAVLMGMGAPAVALGGGLLAQDSAIWRGFAYPVLIMGALEFIGGLVFYLRIDRPVRGMDKGLSTDPVRARNLEMVHMRRINLQFRLIQIFEISLLVGGMAMAAAGAGTRNETLSGVGVGLALESAALLTFDLFAGKRGLRYTGSLEHLKLTASPNLTPAGAGLPLQGGATVSMLGSF